MLVTYDRNGVGLQRRDPDVPPIGDSTLWVDLFNPTTEEEKLVEAALGIDIPTREELQEIEASSRLYQEDGVHFMTATLLIQIDAPRPVSTTVTFILTAGRLITVRYAEPRSFELFAGRAMRGQIDCASATATLIGLLEIIVDRHADLIERIQSETDRISHELFVQGPPGRASRVSIRLNEILRRIGREGDIASRAREAMLSLNRLLTYLGYVAHNGIVKDERPIRARIKTALRDVTSLTDHLTSVGSQITFLLDAVLGMISIEQNAIIKFFSVVAVVFLPPTLIASIYGMNFDHMPELQWSFGYPMALAAMVLVAILPWVWFRFKGWL